nr:ferredoxin [Mesobacterium pallidum]
MPATDLGALASGAAARHLTILGGFHPAEGESLLLLGPGEPSFWPAFEASPERADGKPDPMDRWSHRVIGAWAAELGATAHFPDDRPFPPFYDWALRSGNCHASPILMLVHDRAGLLVSFRGALRLPWHVDLPATAPSPCTGCARPCLSTCPVGALTTTGYDVAACTAWIGSPDGAECLTAGCLARRACPPARDWPRDPRQSAFHMAAFLAANGVPPRSPHG